MNICFFTKHEIDWGSSRQRVGVYLDYLRQRGHSCDIIYCIPNWLSKAWIGGKGKGSLVNTFYSFWYGRIIKYIKLIRLVMVADKYDKILIQKVNLLPIFVRALRAKNKNIIFDFDDQCFWDSGIVGQKKIGIAKRFYLWRRGLAHPRVLRLYSHVIAGNSHLSGLASVVTEKGRVSLIPTPIDCKLYSPMEKGVSAGPLVVGWAGSGENHLRHLELLAEPLRRLVKRYDINFKLVGLMGSGRIKGMFEFLGSRFISIDWVSGNELPEIIRSFDIGVMPLADDDESRGKCGFKALQYMASGIPVVISPVGVNKEIVEDGVSGFLADGADEWVKKIFSLIEDKELMKNFGMRGRQAMEEKYSLDKIAKVFIETLERA